MKKMFLILTFIVASATAQISDLNITSRCNGLILKDIVWESGIDYNGVKEMRFDYSLKNSTNNEIRDIRLKIFLKDNKGHRIFDSVFSAGNLKPYYAKPMDKSTYYSVSPLPDDFSRYADLEATCNNASAMNKTNSSSYEIFKIQRDIFNKIKNHTKNKTDLEARIEIGLLIQLLSKSDSFEKLLEKLK